MAVVNRTREAIRCSAFACELRAANSPRRFAFISNLCHLSSRLVQGWPRLQHKVDFMQNTGPLRHSCSCGKPHRILRDIAPRGQFATQVLPLFPVGIWSTVLEATSKTLWDGVSILKDSDQECGDEAKAVPSSNLHHPNSPGYQCLLTASWTLSESSWHRPSLPSQVVPLIFHRLILLLAPTLPSKVHRLWIPSSTCKRCIVSLA